MSERPTQPLPSFLCSPPSPLSLTGCPGRPPQPTLLRPSSVPFSSSAVAVHERRPARHWPLLAAAPTTRPGKRRDQRPASYRAPLACHRPLLAAAPMPRPGARRRTNVQPATGAPLAFHRPLLAAALVRGFPALVLRLRLRYMYMYKDLPPRFFANKLTPFRGSMGLPRQNSIKLLSQKKKIILYNNIIKVYIL